MLLSSEVYGWVTLGLRVRQKGWTEAVRLEWGDVCRLVVPMVEQGEVLGQDGFTFEGRFRLLDAEHGTPNELMHFDLAKEVAIGASGFPGKWDDEVPYGTSMRYRLVFDGTIRLYNARVMDESGKVSVVPILPLFGDRLVDETVAYAQPDKETGWFAEGRRDLFVPHQRPHPKDLELGLAE